MSREYYKTKASVEQYINLAKDVSGIELIENDFEILLLEAYQEFEDGDSLLLIGRKK